MVGYALLLGVIALLLEMAARHAHQRSLAVRTIGFTYHPDRDIWQCPRDQHLFPVFSDPAKGVVRYRAPASTCNACQSKAACTDSNSGREIERRTSSLLEYGMQRFHRAMSLTLLALSTLILIIEIIRTAGIVPRLSAGILLAGSCAVMVRIVSGLLRDPSQNAARKTLLDSQTIVGQGRSSPFHFREL